MAYPELYLNLNYNQKVICAIVIVGLVILVQIIARIKNKTQKRTSKQVTCQRNKKTFNPANFISNYNEFITENTKGMSLFEIKDFKEIANQEIYRMILKGVR